MLHNEWEEKDLNLRKRCCQIYSLIPLANSGILPARNIISHDLDKCNSDMRKFAICESLQNSCGKIRACVSRSYVIEYRRLNKLQMRDRAMMDGLNSGKAIISLMYFNPFESIFEFELFHIYLKLKSGK